MCQKLIRDCAVAVKPLVFIGSVITLLDAFVVAYVAHSSQELYQDIDASAAQSHLQSYYLQLAVAVYLLLLTIFNCLSVHFDHKHSIRVLTIVTAVNFILAAAAFLMIPNRAEVDNLFVPRLKEAQTLYDFSETLPTKPDASNDINATLVLNSTANARQTRWVESVSNEASSQEPLGAKLSAKLTIEALNKSEATKIWDRLQARGCCAINNSTAEWKDTYPKSCCAKPVTDGAKTKCNADSVYNWPCINVIEKTTYYAPIAMLFSIALNNLYLMVVFGASAYRTFHYDEASQNAYS